MFLSIVIPAYNEEKRIGATLRAINEYITTRDLDCEVIVVDDGSSDGTVREAEGSFPSGPGILRVVSNGRNRGKGFSVRNGINSSRGDYVLLCDADMSTPVNEVEKLLGCLGNGEYDIAIGSRSIRGANVGVRQPWHRERMGKVFNFFVRMLLLESFRDTQCGFKLFKGDVARDIAKDLRIDGFCFDVEMLYLARKKGHRAVEVGVVWDNSPQSKVRIFDSSANMFFDLINIKRFHG